MKEDKIIKVLQKHDEKIDDLQKDMTGMKKDMSEMKEDVTGLKKDMVGVKKDLHRVEGQIDFLARVVVDHTERLDRIEENMATKKDINKIMNTLDRVVSLYEKKDQELTIATHDMRKVEDRVGVLETDMRQVKPALGLA